MNKKTIITSLIMVCILLFPCPIKASEYDGFIINGECGDGVFWEFADGILTISGSGSITDNQWYDFGICDEITDVIIEDGVTSICQQAFLNCKALRNVIMADSVLEISPISFYGCNNIETIYLSQNLITIGYQAFQRCKSLQSLDIPASVQHIDGNAFMECGFLNINVDSNNKYYSDIDGVLFDKSQTELIAYAKDAANPVYNIPDTTKYIKAGSFEGCADLVGVSIPNSVIEIEENAFFSCSGLRNITIPNSVKSIGKSAFQGCSSLTDVTLSYGMTEVVGGTFWGCTNITNIFIPNSIKKIEYATFGSFNDTSNSANIYFSGSQEEWDMVVIEDINYMLSNATVYFNADEIPSPAINNVQVDSNYHFSISLQNIQNDSLLVAVLYKKGALTGINTDNIHSGDTSKSITVNADSADYAKVFVWNDIDGMRPVCSAVEVPIG